MSERDDEIEEEGILDHWSHDEHPLRLMEPHDMGAKCYGCARPFRRGEQAYGCSNKKCGYTKLLHQECAEMPRKITLLEHGDNQHILILQHALNPYSRCRICWWETAGSIAYQCTSPGCEEIKIHMRCARASCMMEAVDDGSSSSCTIHHPSHPPNHQLRLFEKRSSFKCDACGVTGRGKSYICNTCEYWIHERCAALPQTMKREDHNHSLSLSFHVPNEYLRYKYKCEVCNKVFLVSKYWIYHCELCRYAVHVKCAFKIKTPISNPTNEKGIICLPTDDAVEVLITPFVLTQGGGGITPVIPPPLQNDDDDGGEMSVNVKKYKFVLHEHELSLISSSFDHHHHDEKEKGEEDSDEEDEEEDWGKRSEIVCDGCITPILPSSSSSSSDGKSSSSYYYMSCSECKYNLHLACFNLPPRLPSLPLLHNEAGHELVLISCPKHEPWKDWDFYCVVCNLITTGLMYGCKKCYFKADVKCASLPRTIHHAALPQNPLNLLTPLDVETNNLSWRVCAADCGSSLDSRFCYAVGDEFVVHVHCAMLPASVRSRRWDRHHPRLPLTYDANLNHPGEFYCDECETKMNPKSWMYHCRRCDLSFHPLCFKLTSGSRRNVKFGQEYSIPTAHPHTLTYQLLTTKRRCDTCGRDWYGWDGFHCSYCNFFICYSSYCGGQMDADGRIHPMD